MNRVRPLGMWGLVNLKKALSTPHGGLMLAGLFVGLIYFFPWLNRGLKVTFNKGSSEFLLCILAISIAFSELAKNRRKILKLEAGEADKIIGCALLVAAILAFLFLRFALLPQALIWFTILVGIALSSWGLDFFLKFPLPVFLFAITVYPQPEHLAEFVFKSFMPYEWLEKTMAQASASALSLFGQPATLNGTIIIIGSNSGVDVYWGCSGFDMIFTMAFTGFLIGTFYKQSWLKVLSIIFIGVILASIFNVFRIMILAIATAYWGDQYFEFWHGDWGGQIFMGLLFTTYYYAIMALINRRPQKAA